MEGVRTTGDIASISRVGIRKARAFSHPIYLLKKVHVVMFEPSIFLTQSCSMRPTKELAQTALFTQRSEGLSILDRTKLSYDRARAIGRAYGSCIRVFQSYTM